MFRKKIKLIAVFALVLGMNFSAMAEVSKCYVHGKCAKQGDLWYKARMTHVWQGVVGGVETKNSDRITGLYDLDFCYLLSVDPTGGENADYVLLNVSTQMGFGNGPAGSKLGYVGGVFGTNDTALGDQDFFVDKCFVEFTMLDRELTFSVGKMLSVDFFDYSRVANSEFTQFMASQLVNNLAIPWPSKGLGAVAKWQKCDAFYLKAGIMDAQAQKREMGFDTAFHDEDYWFSMAEVGVAPKFFDKDGLYRFIVWYDPQDKEYLDGSALNKRDDLGFALSFDQDINDNTTLFFRYGWADDKVNSVKNTVSFGGQIKGLIEGRESDVLGIGYADNGLSTKSLTSDETSNARILEAYYNCKVNDNINITPSLQVAFDPGTSKNESPATIFGVRVTTTF